jgi:ubiquinone biosynthesis protein COQ9
VFDGWSGAALAAACADEGLDATLPDRLFPGGAVDAVAHFVDLADRMMVLDVAETDMEALRVPQRITAIITARLTRWEPHREAIRRAMTVLALPSHVALAARLAWNTADAIWRAAGDASHDFSWYTRRASLTAVYGATLLYWLDDGTEGAADTQAFLQRRLGDVGTLTRTRRRVEEALSRRMPRMAAGRLHASVRPPSGHRG